ncbi:MAG: MFS transporter [Selenomonadaceae bacterium]|nr:MFS transporter [Selenomonadaceae bacterium]
MLNNQEAGLSMREWLPLAGMTCAAFLFNTSEFMPIGLLSAIAEDFAMTEAEIGRIVSIYAWVVMVLSMPLMVWASRYGLRALILSTLGVFILSNSLASLANDFWTCWGRGWCWHVPMPFTGRLLHRRRSGWLHRNSRPWP